MRQGYVYKLVCLDENITDTYIGSCWNMKDRHKQHKHSCYDNKLKKYNTPLYQFIREHGGWDNWGMETIEICECRDTRHLETVEQFYIDVEGGIDFLLNEQNAVMDKEKNRQKDVISTRNIQQRNKDTKRFYCECCDIAFGANTDLQRHTKTKRHIKKMASSFS